MEPDADNGSGTSPEASAPAIERGTYEVIRDRLVEQSRGLRDKANRLNERRLALFGGTEMAIVGTERIRTENNCVPRDIVAVGDRMLFGYNVFIGLKTETAVGDVFSLHRFERTDGRFAFEPVPPDSPDYFLSDPQFQNPTARNFRLKSGSPALRKGTSQDYAPLDFDKRTRSPSKGIDPGSFQLTQ